MKIHLAAEPARPRSGQGGLFLPPSPEPEKLELTLARIAGMVGEKKSAPWNCSTPIIPKDFACSASSPKSQGKILHEKDARFVSGKLNRHRPAPFPPRTARQRDSGKWPARATGLPRKKEVQGDVLWKAGPWRFSGDWWERERLVPRRMGPRSDEMNDSNFFLPPGARFARRRLVRGRNL